MPLLVAGLLIVVALVALIPLIPLALVQRYRVGTSRQRGRRWLATLNVAGFVFSTVLFFGGAAVTTMWLPRALPYAAAGFLAGLLLGSLGLRLTRWERTREALYFTPNRALVLLITLTVTARIVYSLWRGWHTWGADDGSWFVAAGAAETLGAAGAVLGYYLRYWTGVRRRIPHP